MRHPTLAPIRKLLVAALGLSGCIAETPAEEPSVDDPPPPCDGVVVPGAAGQPSGFMRCDDGSIDRVGPASCEPFEYGSGSCEDFGEAFEGDCSSDADCDAGRLGRCENIDPSGFSCSCRYFCDSDADCPGSNICACRITANGAITGTCVPPRCESGDDCGEGGRCGVTRIERDCEAPDAVGCRTGADECAAGPDCGEFCTDEGCFGRCFPAGIGEARVMSEPEVLNRWHCDTVGYVCGRPLRVDAAPRLAAGTQRGGWQARQRVEACAPADRAALAAHWGQIAALEHASVASFARFSMQLMALGAPADLLADCQQAAADEVRHARLAYGIATAFAGEVVGPGPLDLSGVELAVDPATVLRETIIEGCIGETMGAVEAAEAARVGDDRDIAAACARIAEDELRHAALGWRVARWLVERDPTLAAVAAVAFADGIRHHSEGITPSPEAIQRRGIAVRPALRRAAVRDIIRPLVGELFG